jgi:hypothetical protein
VHPHAADHGDAERHEQGIAIWQSLSTIDKATADADGDDPASL